jgi:hypothetical protein
VNVEAAREMTVLLGDRANRHAVTIRTHLAPNLPEIIGDRAASAGAHEPHAQRHRGDE